MCTKGTFSSVKNMFVGKENKWRIKQKRRLSCKALDCAHASFANNYHELFVFRECSSVMKDEGDFKPTKQQK